MYGKRKKGLAGALSVACAVGFLIGSLSAAGNVAYADEGQYAVAERELTVDGVYEGESVKVEEEPTVDFTGTMTEQEEAFDFAYTAERDGKYRIDVLDVKANCEIKVYVYDSLGNEVTTLSHGATVDFETDETYSVNARKYEGNTNFTIRITPQKETIDISDITELEDQITFEYQKNRYTYTAPYSGYYRFTITDKTANAEYRLLMWDQYDTNIVDTYIDSNGEGSGIELQAGETYVVQMRQYEGVGKYTMKIYPQKPQTEISGYTLINDEIEFEGQRNYYNFTAPVSGEYSIKKIEKNVNSRLAMALFGEDSEVFNYTSVLYLSDAAQEQQVDLEEGETYQLLVAERSNGMGNYEVKIKYPLEAQSFLDSFVPETEEQEAESDSAGSETEAVEQTEDPRVGELQEQNAALESELAQMKEENDMIMEALKDLGVDLEQETE